MARPKTDVDLHKHTLNLRKGDMEALAALFPKHHPSVMVRKIVSKFVDQVQQVPEEQVKPTDLSL